MSDRTARLPPYLGHGEAAPEREFDQYAGRIAQLITGLLHAYWRVTVDKRGGISPRPLTVGERQQLIEAKKTSGKHEAPKGCGDKGDQLVQIESPPGTGVPSGPLQTEDTQAGQEDVPQYAEPVLVLRQATPEQSSLVIGWEIPRDEFTNTLAFERLYADARDAEGNHRFRVDLQRTVGGKKPFSVAAIHVDRNKFVPAKYGAHRAVVGDSGVSESIHHQMQGTIAALERAAVPEATREEFQAMERELKID